ncbi:eCIS core domain-containing protein [Streptomyces cyaneochromogenes]|uniref:eCIS core domain-containing protein n=1 Tax=Streptomyces cyaneochromogenes TaxID=2496836 RepID=UPI003899E21D
MLRAPGQPLDPATRTDMEARLGADFSDVRLHTGPAAQRSAADVGARAYTSGNHIVIGSGGADRHTLAHELTHVIQQRQGPVAGTDNGSGLSVSDPSDHFERAAEENARRVMSGPAPTEAAPVQRITTTPAHTDEEFTAQPVRRAAGAVVPAAAQVVQRVPDWADAAAAAARQRVAPPPGWEWNEEGELSRIRVPATGELAGGPRTEAAQQEQEQEAGDDPITLRILVRKNASFRDENYLQRVGHSWVAFYKDNKFESSAGFYPKGGQINQDAPHQSVPGEVRMNYDDPSNATTELSVPLTQKQFSKAQKYIQKNLNREYNLLRYNCTDFAIGVHKAATGHSPPGRNLLLPNNPNDLHSGIKKHNKRNT